ncbi:MAG: DEAD/DEAH box helicase, partial [Candidatus Eisenbacteria bacterium]|nr:DEAD/DEAH box helicase [Candidatus Eisenbacteria bacterium]
MPASERAELFLWGELDEPEEGEDEPDTAHAREHPAVVPPRALRSLLRNVGDGLLYECSDESALEMLWPTRHGRPLASVDLRDDATTPSSVPARDVAASATRTVRSHRLDPWRVEGLGIPPIDSLRFLHALEEGTLARDLAAAPTLRYWQRAAWLAFALLSRGRFVPTLVEEARPGRRGMRALWKPVLTAEPDRRCFLEMVDLMPPVCRAVRPAQGEGERPRHARSARSLLQNFLDTVTDATIRTGLAEAGFPERGRGGRARSSLPGGPVSSWLRSLAWIEDRIELGTQSVEDFAIELRLWNRGVVDPEAGSVHLHLDLEVPESDDPAVEWTLSFHLRASEDPSTSIPAETVWAEPKEVLRRGSRQVPHAQERLLLELARAARVVPAIGRSLEARSPTEAKLTLVEAYDLLAEGAPQLEALGISFQAPDWWKARPERPRYLLYLRPAEDADGSASMEPGTETEEPENRSGTLLAYDWKVALGDAHLTPEEFHALAQAQRPLVRIEGNWVEVRPEDAEVLGRILKERKAHPTLSLPEALRLGLGGLSGRTAVPRPEVHADGWVAHLLDHLGGRAEPEAISPGNGFVGTLRAYQERGVGWLDYLERFGLGGCLADDMGLGKTVQLIALLTHERERARERLARLAAAASSAPPEGAPDEVSSTQAGSASPVAPTLVLAPMSVVGNWQRELQRFGPNLRVLVHHGLTRIKDGTFAQEVGSYDVVISTYALARRDHERLREVLWHRIVLDEAQNIKNPATQQSRAVRALASRHRVALTGTPLENRLSELWSILDFLNPGYLGTLGDFLRRFARPIEKGGSEERRNLLGSLTRPLLLRRLKTDPDVIRDLPEKLEMRIYCNLTQEQAALYQVVVEEMLGRIDRSEGIERRGLVLTALTRLKQICNHPSHYKSDGGAIEGRSGKVERLAEMLEEVLAVGDRALCFTQFTEMGDILQEHLKKRLNVPVSFLHGGTPQAERDRMVEEFQSESGPPIFLLSVRAGGTGLNLTAANHVFHFDRWWNPAVEDQASDRAFRIGQTRNVQVHKFVCVGTLEERIDRIIEEKRSLAEVILRSGESWLAELST